MEINAKAAARAAKRATERATEATAHANLTNDKAEAAYTVYTEAYDAYYRTSGRTNKNYNAKLTTWAKYEKANKHSDQAKATAKEAVASAKAAKAVAEKIAA
jgi:hypothetical protein